MTGGPSIDFAGCVAIVTGAGSGMGRDYALSLAARGCAVVVNDYGGDPSGRGGSASPANIVAREIIEAGGTAIADAHPVGTPETARAIVDAALVAFGRVDILINNAGISAPGPVEGPSDDQIAAVLLTNLAGPLALTRAVWPTMRGQGYGRILNVSSNAAFGVGGSVAYAASKAGLLGLTFETGGLGRAFGIGVNAILPVAYTRMIDAAPDAAFVAWMKANMPVEQVTAAALYLVSKACGVSGQVFSVGGGRVARAGFMGGRGLFEADLTPEQLRDHETEMTSLASPRLIASSRDDIAPLFELYPMARPEPG